MDHKNTEIVHRAARCLTMLISNKAGKDLSVEINLLPKLNELLHSEVNIMNLLVYVLTGL